MRRKLFILFFALAMGVTAVAQRIVESSEEFVSYDRNSISVIITRYNDSYDQVFANTVNGFDYGSKFDINNIDTKTISVNQSRMFQEGTMVGWTYSTDAATLNSVASYINNNNVGKEILTYILSPDAQGRFTRDVMNTRGQWNAKDKDYIESKATQVDAMGQNGEQLIDNSYIIVFDMKNPKKTETTAKDNKGQTYTIVTWDAYVGAMVFEIANADELIGDVLNNMWINDRDDDATKIAKRKAFSDLQVNMKLAASVGVHTSGKDLSVVVANAKSQLMTKLEDEIPTWQVTIDCETVEPFITARIGTKEGVRNGQRYGVYGQVFNQSKDRLEFKRKGYVRATEVSNNKRVADGTADPTYFYRISGTASLNGTEILKQRNDLGIGISANYTMNGSNSEPVQNRTFGSFSMVEVGIDYLVFIQKRGFSHYAMINLGFDKLNGDNLYKGQKEFGKYGAADIVDIENQFLFKNGASYMNVSIGYVFGIKIKQFAELQPFIRGGIDMLTTSADVDENMLRTLAITENYVIKNENDLKKSSSAYYLDPGIRLTFNVIYPVQLYLQANYSILLTGGDKYNIINNYFKDCGYGHSNGLGIGGGLRIVL